MHATRTSPIVGQRDIRTALSYGRAAGPWLIARDQQRAAIAMAEQAWLLKEAGGPVSAASIVDRLCCTIGVVLVRIGWRLQASAGTPTVATQP